MPASRELPEGENRYAFDAVGGRAYTLHMFPATTISGMSIPLPDGSKMGMAHIICVAPKGLKKSSLWGVSAVSPAMADMMKMRARGNSFNAINLLIGIDDVEQWPGVQRGARGYVGQQEPMRYFAQLGINRPEGWPRSGNVHAGFSKDDDQKPAFRLSAQIAAAAACA